LKEFPPQNPQNFLFLGRSGPLDYRGKNVLEYEIPVSPTSYEFVGVLWKEKGQDWNLTGLMGFYTGATGSFFPDTVFLSPDQPVVEDVDFTANWELVAKDASISGNIYYHGDWPQETAMLILAVFPNKPKTMFEFFTASNFDYTQPIFVDSSNYRLGVNSGVYNYIVLYWIGKNIKNLDEMIELGYFEDNNNSGEPGSIQIFPNQELDNIDIIVNFDQIIFP
ncbi:MAG: hypothetical protein SCK70_17355, partial [bacterium]|nr:hypothetical protein [bacterium]